MQEEDLRSDVTNLAVVLREDGIKLWTYRCHREAEVHLGTYHVQERSSDKEELIGEKDKLRVPTRAQEETEALEVDIEEDEEHVRTFAKEEATALRNETTKMWHYRSLLAIENDYHELTQPTGGCDDNMETLDDNSRFDKELNGSHKQEDVTSDSEESFHSLEEFIPDGELNKQFPVIESGSEGYDDAERLLYESVAVQTIAPTVQHVECQTIDIMSGSVSIQTDCARLLDASVNTVTMATSTASTNTVIITTNEVNTNTVTMVTQHNATNTDVKEFVDTETNTTSKTMVDAIIQTEKLLMSRSQSDYESLIDKYKKYNEALRTEMTQEKSQRLVAEQMVTIVQSEVESLRQRNIDLTSQQIKLENELSETKVEYLQSQKMLKERDQRIVELNDSLTGTSLLVKKLEEQSTQVLMGRGGIDYMLEAKLSSGRALEAEQKVEVLQAELLQSHSEVKSLLDKISELTREKAENVSHVVHTQLLQIADEKALQAETKCRQLENEVLSLKRQLQATSGLSEASGLTSSLLSNTLPLSSYSLYGKTTTNSAGFLYSYPTTLSYYGNSSYTSLYTSQPSDGGLLLGKSKSTNYSHDTSSYRNTLTTTNETSGSNFGYKYQTPVATTSPLLSTVPSSSDTFRKSRDHVTMDIGKNKNKQDKTTEAMLVLPELVDITDVSSPVQAKPTTSHGSGESSDWSSSDDDGDPYANSPLKPSMLASKTAQWEWRSQQKHQSNLTSPKVIARSSSVKTRPPVPPKPVRSKMLHRSHSNPVNDTATIIEEASSFNEPAKGPNLKSISRPKGPKGRTLPRKKGIHFEQLLTVTVPEI